MPVKRFDGRVRIYLHDGFSMEGCCLRVEGGRVTLNSGLQAFGLDQVAQIEIRKSRAAPLAKLSGGCCGLLALLALLDYDGQDGGEEVTRWDVLAGGLVWTGLATAAGAAIGYLASDWEPIYFSVRPSAGAQGDRPGHRVTRQANALGLGLRWPL